MTEYQHHLPNLFQSTPSAWRETCIDKNKPKGNIISIHSLRMEGDLPPMPIPCNSAYFNPLPPHGGRHLSKSAAVSARSFQSTPSAWRETQNLRNHNSELSISIHSLRMEGDQEIVDTLNVRGFHFNPLPPHGGRPFLPPTFRSAISISIHSLRMEGDCIQCPPICNTGHFNPLPPHGGRLKKYNYSEYNKGFQSTPSAWRETSASLSLPRENNIFQSTPSAWRETTDNLFGYCYLLFQSTPSAWRETSSFRFPGQFTGFQSTPSAWRETDGGTGKVHGGTISIHSLRMEGDTIDTQTRKIILKFQSTPSAWRETLVIIPFNARFTFQSTPSAWRETRTETALHPSSAYFNPLPPHGGRRPSSAVSSADHSVFQSTPSAWRETDHPRGSHGCCAYFNPLPPHGGRPPQCARLRR